MAKLADAQDSDSCGSKISCRFKSCFPHQFFMEKFEGTVVDNGINGNGIVKNNCVVCFIPFSIKGEKISYEILKNEKNFCSCKLVDIIEKSPFRTEPKCKYFGTCGGCQLQHMNKNFQLDFKTSQVKNILTRALKTDVEVKKCLAANEYAYRNKVNFSISNNKLCFVTNEMTKIEIENCPLFKSNLSQIICAVNKYLFSVKNNLKALHVRQLDCSFSLTFVSEFGELKQKELLISLLESLDINFSIFICKNTVKNSSNLTNDVKLIYGSIFQNYEILGVKSKISPSSFLQVNEEVQNLIYLEISKEISFGNVINAYGGTGILSSILSKSANKVFSVEINKSAAKNCEEMIKINNLKNIESICGNCKIEIPKILKNETISHIVFDPPRSGIDKSILELLSSLKIPNLIYLSCNPSTLARDLKDLCKVYEIVKIQPFDMFPQTSHVETLVVLKHKKTPR